MVLAGQNTLELWKVSLIKSGHNEMAAQLSTSIEP